MKREGKEGEFSVLYIKEKEERMIRKKGQEKDKLVRKKRKGKFAYHMWRKKKEEEGKQRKQHEGKYKKKENGKKK